METEKAGREGGRNKGGNRRTKNLNIPKIYTQ